ncbi:hypothetical protein EV421DRAFT_2085296 [Armillaria borealis]|uniref:Uncharacterized protein n=1 Tax=Armillaria borealis TaxID=47425 RepID=A0AA39JAT4_9AGAR|nr:hypothetical protein EV421DRAFT_2085296 [Armillaria borealis]
MFTCIRPANSSLAPIALISIQTRCRNTSGGIRRTHCAGASMSRPGCIGLPVTTRYTTTGIRPAATDSRGSSCPNNGVHTGGGRRHGKRHEGNCSPSRRRLFYRCRLRLLGISTGVTCVVCYAANLYRV